MKSKLNTEKMLDLLIQDDVDYLYELFIKNNIDEIYNFLANNHICYCYLYDDEIEDRYYQSRHWEKEWQKINKNGEIQNEISY